MRQHRLDARLDDRDSRGSGSDGREGRDLEAVVGGGLEVGDEDVVGVGGEVLGLQGVGAVFDLVGDLVAGEDAVGLLWGRPEDFDGAVADFVELEVGHFVGYWKEG